MMFTPQTLAVVGLQQVLLTGGTLLYQYHYALNNAVELAHQLATKIRELQQSYDRVRIVAHSLGCKILIEAVKELPLHLRPDEIHLCAPAIAEAEHSQLLDHLAKVQTFVYYCERDWVLEPWFRIAHSIPAVGAVGLQRKYIGLTAVNVDKHFDTLVHFEYKRKFHEFAKDGYASGPPYSSVNDIIQRPDQWGT